MLGNVKTVMKKAILFIPGFGLSMYLMNWVFLSRSWEKDEKVLNGQLDQFRKDGFPIWLWCFPEGTRMCKKKLDDAQVHLIFHFVLW